MTENAPKSGRGSDGRFVPGNRCGRGNPHLARLAAAQEEMRAAVKPGHVKRVLAKLYALAIAGDVVAAKVWLDRVLGKPAVPPLQLQHAFENPPPGPPVPAPVDLAAGIAQLAALSREVLSPAALPAIAPASRNGHGRKPESPT